MNTTNIKPLFPLGQIVATPGALELLDESGQAPSSYISRHVSGEWGDICKKDKQLNDAALKDGNRLLSAYQIGEGKLWIITEADRSSTALLLPCEY